jgi:predicted permease
MHNFWQDVRYALRMLGSNVGFTAVAVLTLALGIGANTAIFTVMNALLLHPAGIAHPEKLVAIRANYEKLNLRNIVISAPDYTFVRDKTDIFAAAALQQQSNFNYTNGNWPLLLRGAKVSWQWFDVFEAKPLLGRTFVPEEDQPKADHEVVLSYHAWKTIFGGDPAILNRSVDLNQQPYKVVGVMGPEFQWPGQTDVWAPLGLDQKAFDLDNIFNENYFAVARLQPQASFAAAESFLRVTTAQVADDPRAQGFPKSSGWSILAIPFTDFVYGDVRTPLLVLLGAVAFVLLIACLNVAGLLLARASARVKEFSIRTALGGSPWRLARQMMTESVVLALAGMLAGWFLAWQGVHLLLRLAPEGLAPGLRVHTDVHVLLFMGGLALFCAIVFGAAPALQIAMIDPQRNLQQGRGAGGDTRHRLRSTLVVAELSLALVLLASAGVFLKSLAKLREVDVGFRPHGLMSAAVALPDASYSKDSQQIAFLRSTLDRLAAAPGVESAAAAVPIPFSGIGGSSSFSIEGRVLPPGDPGPHGDIRAVSAGYFETMGIPVLRGRVFTAEDREGAQPVAVIDANLAKQYWPNEDPVGKHLRQGGPKSPWITVVGVVAPIRHSQVAGEESSNMGQETGKGTYYFPLFQQASPAFFLVVRSNLAAIGMGQAIESAVHGVDPSQPVSDLKTLDERIAISLGPRRSAVTLLTIFAVMALTLAAVGLFGLVRYSVTQRTQEIGVRMAIGASQRDVLTMVLGEVLRLALAGLAGGLIASFALTRVLTSLLYGVSATDPLTFIATGALLVLVALVASWMPAYRATRIDPLVALRYE